MLVQQQFRRLFASFFLTGLSLSPIYADDVPEEATNTSNAESNSSKITDDQKFEKIKGRWFLFQVKGKEYRDSFELGYLSFNFIDRMSVFMETYSKDFEDEQFHKISTSQTDIAMKLEFLVQDDDPEKISFKIRFPNFKKYSLKWEHELLKKPYFYKRRVTDFMKKNLELYDYEMVEKIGHEHYTKLLQGVVLTLINPQTLKIENKVEIKKDSIHPGDHNYIYRPSPLEVYLSFDNLKNLVYERDFCNAVLTVVENKKESFFRYLPGHIISFAQGFAFYWIINKYLFFKTMAAPTALQLSLSAKGDNPTSPPPSNENFGSRLVGQSEGVTH